MIKNRFNYVSCFSYRMLLNSSKELWLSNLINYVKIQIVLVAFISPLIFGCSFIQSWEK